MGNREEYVMVSGVGRTREEAFAKAMASIQKTLARQVKETIIRIEPLEVVFQEGEEKSSSERFLFFFLKRTISTFKIKIRVKVNLFVVDVNSFEFENVKETGVLKKLLGAYK